EPAVVAVPLLGLSRGSARGRVRRRLPEGAARADGSGARRPRVAGGRRLLRRRPPDGGRAAAGGPFRRVGRLSGVPRVSGARHRAAGVQKSARGPAGAFRGGRRGAWGRLGRWAQRPHFGGALMTASDPLRRFRTSASWRGGKFRRT